MIAADQHVSIEQARSVNRTTRAWLWLAVASSSIVFVEPAICDLLISLLLPFALVTGLRLPGRITFAIFLLGVFLLGNLISSVLAPDPTVSLKFLATRFYLVGAWWFLVASLVCTDAARINQTIWNAYLLAALLAAALGVLALFDVIPNLGEQLVDGGRVRALFKDPNVFGPFLVPPVLYALSRSKDSGGLRAPVYLGIAALLFLGVLVSFSRGSLLNFAVAILCYLSLGTIGRRLQTRAARTMLIGMTAVGLLGLAVVLVMNYSPTRTILEDRATLVMDYDIRSDLGAPKSRLEAQIDTFKLAMANPLGIGAGQSGEVEFQNRAPHNLYLHVLVESGWLGGIAFYAFLLLTLQRAWPTLRTEGPNRDTAVIIFSCIVGILAQSFFIDSTHWRHFYLLLGMLWGAIAADRSGENA